MIFAWFPWQRQLRELMMAAALLMLAASSVALLQHASHISRVIARQQQQLGLSTATANPTAAAPSSGQPHQRVLVTGAAGFIGWHTARALRHTWPGAQVVGLDSFNSHAYSPSLKRRRQELLASCCNISILQADINDGSQLCELFRQHNFSLVVHLAAQAGVRLSAQQPAAYVRSNVQGTATLLQAMVHCRQPEQPAPALVYASSSSVYGSACGMTAACHESSACQPVSVYAASKLATELMVSVFVRQHGLAATGLRLFTVYGSMGRPDMAVMAFAARLLAAAPITIPCFALPAAAAPSVLQQHANMPGALPLPPPGCVPPVRDFTHVSDVVTAAAAAAAAAGASWHRLYNLGRGQPVPVVQLLEHLQLLLGRRAVRVVFQPVAGSSSDVPATWADSSAAKQDLGWQAQVELLQGLLEFVSWYAASDDV